MNKIFICSSVFILQLLSFVISAQTIVPVISPRIVGGSNSEASQWPSMVSIKQSSGSKSHFCGATLIAPQWVLTAAHCVFDNNDQIASANQVVATIGEYDLNSNPTTEPSTISQIIAHPNYNPVTLVNDIALLKLSVPVNDEIMTILNIDSTIELISENAPVTVLGWGSTQAYDPTQPSLPSYPSILQQVELQLYTESQCKLYLSNHYTAEMICAGSPSYERDSCSGDSGGPVLVATNLGWQQLGIVSWGYGCSYENYPSAYTRVAIYIDWIRSITSGFSVAIMNNFVVDSVDSSDSHRISVSNNSEFDGSFTYQMSGSDYFSFDATACLQIAANTSCEFDIIYSPLEYGQQTALFNVSSDIPESISITAQLTGTLASDDDGGSSGSMGLFMLLLAPLLCIRRYMNKMTDTP